MKTNQTQYIYIRESSGAVQINIPKQKKNEIMQVQ